METEIIKILKRGIFTLVSILLIIVLNAYLNYRYESDFIAGGKHNTEIETIYTELKEKDVPIEKIGSDSPNEKLSQTINDPAAP